MSDVFVVLFIVRQCNHFIFFNIFRCVHASLYEGLSDRPSVGRSIGGSVTRFFSNRGIRVETA